MGVKSEIIFSLYVNECEEEKMKNLLQSLFKSQFLIFSDLQSTSPKFIPFVYVHSKHKQERLHVLFHEINTNM